MATLVQKVGLVTDGTFNAWVQAAAVEHAFAVLGETPVQTETGQRRRQLAYSVLSQPATYAYRFTVAVAVAVDDGIASQLQLAIADAAIRERVAAVWDQLAGGYAIA